MKCLICHTPDEARPGNDTSDFEALFGTLVRRKPEYSWLIDNGGYSPWPASWLEDEKSVDALEAEYLLNTERGPLVSTAFLEEYMSNLNDFWLEVYGFQQKSPRFSPGRLVRADTLPQCRASARCDVRLRERGRRLLGSAVRQC